MEIKIKLKTLSLCVLMWCCIKSPRCVSFHRADSSWTERDFNLQTNRRSRKCHKRNINDPDKEIYDTCRFDM